MIDKKDHQPSESSQGRIILNKAEQRKTLFLYTLFSLSVAAVFIPNLALSIFVHIIPNVMATTVFAIMVTICILAGLYSVRSNAEEDSLLENHTTYIIRVFWKMNLILFYCSNISLIYLIIMLDYATLEPCLKYIEQHAIALAQAANIELMQMVIEFCEKPFYKDNALQMNISGLIAFGPAFFYYAHKTIKGWILISQNKIVVPYGSIKR